MKTSTKIVNKRATDPFDILIFEKGLRAKDLLIYPDLDLMVVILNSGKTLDIKISDFKRLKKANEKQLKNWKMIGRGIGFHWEDLDEDLSLRGFIKMSAYQKVIQNISNKKTDFILV